MIIVVVIIVVFVISVGASLVGYINHLIYGNEGDMDRAIAIEVDDD